VNVRRGEILRINLNPIQGREQSGNARPCLVLSNTRFNQRRQGIVIVSPCFTSTIKPKIKTLVEIPDGFKISGSVLAEQVRTIDLQQRWWKTTEVILPDDFVNSVTHILSQLLS
jgi:mRNA-degrading endonuclease toxin of MazEF toxin-antitoxin module